MCKDLIHLEDDSRSVACIISEEGVGYKSSVLRIYLILGIRGQLLVEWSGISQKVHGGVALVFGWPWLVQGYSPPPPLFLDFPPFSILFSILEG